jgi:hypothetical protein
MTIMKNEMINQLDNIINELGIDAVMGRIKQNHANKVFIPNWYYQSHLETMGFNFDELTMGEFGEFMEDHNIYEVTSQTISEDYPEMWEEFVEECC